METIYVIACSDSRLNEYLDRFVEEERRKGNDVILERTPGAILQPTDESVLKIKQEQPKIDSAVVFEHYNCGMAEIQRQVLVGEMDIPWQMRARFVDEIISIQPQLALMGRDRADEISSYVERTNGKLQQSHVGGAFPGVHIEERRIDIPALHDHDGDHVVRKAASRVKKEGKEKTDASHQVKKHFIVAPVGIDAPSASDMAYYIGVDSDRAYIYQKAVINTDDVVAMVKNPKFHIGDRVTVFAKDQNDMKRAERDAGILEAVLGFSIQVVAPARNGSAFKKKETNRG